jgi:hypothetical protein
MNTAHAPFWMNLIPWDIIQTLVAGLVATYVIKPFCDVVHINATSKVRDDMQRAINNALQYAIANAKGNAADIVENDELWNSVLDIAKDYLNENAASMLKHLGITESEATKALEAQVLNAVNMWVYQNGQIKAVAADPTNAVPSTTVNVSTAAAA